MVIESILCWVFCNPPRHLCRKMNSVASWVYPNEEASSSFWLWTNANISFRVLSSWSTAWQVPMESPSISSLASFSCSICFVVIIGLFLSVLL